MKGDVPKKTTNPTVKKKEATLARILQATKNSNGLIINIAKKARLDRSTIYDYLREFPEVGREIEAAKERLYDTAESKIFEKIKAGDTTMLIFFAKTRMKHRGYSERQEVPAEGLHKVIIEFVDFPEDDPRRVGGAEYCDGTKLQPD